MVPCCQPRRCRPKKLIKIAPTKNGTIAIAIAAPSASCPPGITRGGPVNATHLMATLSFQRAIPGGQLAEGAAIAMAMVPFLVGAILISFFGLQRRGWQQGTKD